MPTYATPGVYYERTDVGGAPIGPLRTDIAGFVGIARRGPLDRALPVDSWRQFVAIFGGFTPQGYLAYSVRAFFENGGRRCWISRVASEAATTAIAVVDDARSAVPAASPAWAVEATSEGVWGNDLEVEWRATHSVQTLAEPLASAPEFVTVASVAGFDRGSHVRVFVTPTTPEYRLVAAVDADRRRLYWVHPRPDLRSPFEAPLRGYPPERSVVVESVEYTLLVRELGRLSAVVQGLSLSPLHRCYGPSVLPAPRLVEPGASHRRAGRERRAAEVLAPVALVELRDQSGLALLQPLRAEALVPRALTGGLDGLAALRVRDFLGEPGGPSDAREGRLRRPRGLSTLEAVSEVALVAIPDIHVQPVSLARRKPPAPCKVDPCLPPPPLAPALIREPSSGDLPPRFGAEQIFEVEQALIEHCRTLQDRFALIDPSFDVASEPRLGIAPLRAFRRRFDADVAALYAPWLLTPDPLSLERTGLRAIPPSGHVAGFIAQTDVKSGVHRAPANGTLSWVQGVTLGIDDPTHAVLNAEHVNAIRVFPGRGLRIFGARTLSSNPDFRYVNVRRLLLMLKKAIRLGTQWATFEPNHRTTRTKLHLALSSLLLEVWRRGALAGKTAQEAFYVDCGETQNPQASRDRGWLVAEVGVAPARPFEFVVLRVGVSDNALEVRGADSLEVVA
jgi:phage tail sheath protein FI